MRIKKLLAVILAAIMLSALCVPAFAEDDGHNWIPLPTSDEGLEDGEYYIDMAVFEALFGAENAEFVDVYRNGQFWFEPETLYFKEIITMPAELIGAEQDNVIELADFVENDGLEWLAYAIRECGEQWYPVATTTEGLSNGDWFIDMSAADEDLSAFLVKYDIYVNPNGDLCKYKLVEKEWPDDADVSADVLVQRFPFMTRFEELVGPWLETNGDETGSHEPSPFRNWYVTCPVSQYVTDAPENPDAPTNEDPQPAGIWQKIVDFLKKIVDFFRNLFS
ncbi:MAG: hypothetical protein IJS90_02100 [Clostridia bacterium]|nr:hypothetical protein [Clostridia bacterium]